MTFGDWEVTVTKYEEFRTIPGDPESVLQKMITFNFHYTPTGFTIPQSLHFIAFHSDLAIKERLADYVVELKGLFVDKIIPPSPNEKPIPEELI